MTVFVSETTFVTVTVIALSNVRETLVPVSVAAVLRVTVVPETAATVVPDAIPVPETESPTLIDAEDEVKVTLVVPEVVLPVVVTAVEKASLVTVCPTLISETSDTIKLLALVNVTLAEVRLDVVDALSVTVVPLTETTVVPSANPLDDVTTAPVTIEEAVDAETVSWVAAVLAVIAVATVVLVTIMAVTVICVSA